MFDPEDNLINRAFDEFSESAMPNVKVAGTAAVRATVRRRRIVRATAFGVLGVLLVAVPTTTYAMSSHGSKSPPSTIAAASVSPTIVVAPTIVATPSTTPSAAPSASPSTSPTPSSGTATAPADRGEITMAQLLAANVTIPAWHLAKDLNPPCPSGRVPLTRTPAGDAVNRYPNPPHTIYLVQVVYTNLDRDGSPETAALVACQVGENAYDKIVAFDRNAAGAIVTLGSVAEGVIWHESARSGGGVTVNVSDMEACCSTPDAFELHQNRSYAWTGSHFAQVGGPTSFISHPKPIRFKVTTASSTWGPAKKGNRVGTVSVTITNESSYTSNKLVVWDDSGDTNGEVLGPAMKLINGIRAGATITVKLVITLPADASGSGFNAGVYEQGSLALGAEPVETPYTIWS
ncbi:MAG TPA: hypothetical protein VGF84_20125 [Micromonosporaceae bacterium]|jgi:hypothetical protein